MDQAGQWSVTQEHGTLRMECERIENCYSVFERVLGIEWMVVRIHRKGLSHDEMNILTDDRKTSENKAKADNFMTRLCSVVKTFQAKMLKVGNSGKVCV